MTNPDGVLAAIDSCLDDYDVGPDAMRWAPDEPDPTTETARSRAHLPEWQYATVGADPAVVEVRRHGQPWGAYLAAERYVASDGDVEYVMPPPPRTTHDGMTCYFAVAGPPGTQPEWQPLNGIIVEDGLTFSNDQQDNEWADCLAQSRELSVTFRADTTGFTESMAVLQRMFAGLPWRDLAQLVTESKRLRAMKSAYNRRRRARNRR